MFISKGETRKLAFFLPNTFTALNMACGFSSMVFTWQNDFYKACIILLLGGIFDSVDGRIARMTGTQSHFGEEFDSISDVVSFGVAPALLVYNKFFQGLGRLGFAISFVFLVCGALRLARFNANIDRVSPDFFQGLPIPTAAFAVVGYVLLSLEFSILNNLVLLSIAYVVFYSMLMISNIPFCSFKNSEWVRRHKKIVLVMLFLILISTFAFETYMIFIIITMYVIASLIYFFRHKGELKDMFVWKNETEHEV